MYGSIRRMCESEKLAAAGIQEVLLLQSTSLLRKYISFIDAAWSSLFHRSVSMHHGREFCPLALWYNVRHLWVEGRWVNNFVVKIGRTRLDFLLGDQIFT